MRMFLTMLVCTAIGAGIGAGIALIFYINGDPTIWEGDSFLWLLLSFTIIGAVVGLIYGEHLYKMKVARDEEARRKAAADSIKWTDEVKQKALMVAKTCEKNAKAYKVLITPNYKADSQMDAIIKELANAAELKGKVDAIANDTKTKGGISK